MSQLFTQHPEPVAPGGKVKICYSGNRPIDAKMSFTPSSIPPVTKTIPANGDGCVEFDIPENAVDTTVSDSTGASDAFAVMLE